MAEYRDEDTASHLTRISGYAAAISRASGYGPSFIETIIYTTPMHDIGKIGIPDSIFLKPEKLTEAEWEFMKQHTLVGSEILKGSTSDLLNTGEIIARTHHEKWDGGGYPAGLCGEEIPLVGRITAVADVFAALTSRCPYKEPLSAEKSFGIIKESKGTHFDPQLSDTFLSISEEIIAIKHERPGRQT